MVGNELYYFANDTMLMTYKIPLVEKAKIIPDLKFVTLLKSADLRKLKNNKCDDCEQHAMDDFIIRFVSSKKSDEFYAPGAMTCTNDSPCLILQKITEEFARIEK